MAERGGGLSLEANAKLYVLKYHQTFLFTVHDTYTIQVLTNIADYGGALYVDDNTNSGTCNSDPKQECFLQVLAVHGRMNKSKHGVYFSHEIMQIIQVQFPTEDY